MAKTKSQKATKGNKDSIGKRLGVKIFGGHLVFVGNVIIKQRGTKFKAGQGTKLGRDYTIYAVKEGKVQFKVKHGRQYVTVV